jgi:hypothetical protein
LQLVRLQLGKVKLMFNVDVDVDNQ